MNFFGKKRKENEIHPAEEIQQTETAPQEVQNVQEKPEVQTQPVHNHRMLNGTQLQRLKESRRLAETKLRNLEDNLKRLRSQQEWLRAYYELKSQLEEEKKLLYDLNKQQAAMTEDAQKLERYEKFESIQGGFQRIKILEQITAQNMRQQSELEHQTEEIRLQWEEQNKMLKQSISLRKQAEERFFLMLDNVFQTQKLDGSTKCAEAEISYLKKTAEEERQLLDNTENNIRQHQEELDLISQELERHRTGRQSMEMHERMLEHGEAILIKLDYLQDIEAKQRTLKAKLKEAYKNQEMENELLSKLFAQYQDILAETEKLEGELSTHRANIQGQDSYKLQERAMRLKSRGEMLLSANSLWKKISAGYNTIEEKTQKLNELRLHIEHTERNIRELETAYGQTCHMCKEKEYNYLLSKGQNVIQLRAGLKEGTACSVCGATHHPFHSDTMLEQSKLINDFKTDFELLDSEARSMKSQLTELQLELAESRGKKQAEEVALRNIQTRQEEDVKEWQNFVSLDKAFSDCSPSTNQHARQTMLGQLIDNTAKDTEAALKELDTFNFHQSRISALSEQLQELEQKKNTLSVRLNEVNTGCQVMVGHVERLQTQLEIENAYYRQVYEELEKGITLTDWLHEWNNSHEGLCTHIQQLMNAWETVNSKIVGEQQELQKEKTILEELEHTRHMLLQRLEVIDNRIAHHQSLLSENQKAVENLLNGANPKSAYLDSKTQMQQAQSEESTMQEESTQIRHRMDRMAGRNDFHAQTNAALREELTEERSRMDLWIRRFNALNSPVQYAELEDVFSESKDWNSIREKIDKIRLETEIARSRVNDLNSRFISQQAEGGYIKENDEDKMQKSLVIQYESTESKIREIILQIARIDITLEENKQADV